MTKKQQIALAMREFESSIDAFSEAMRKADMSYITKGGTTPNMRLCWMRYTAACDNLLQLGIK